MSPTTRVVVILGIAASMFDAAIAVSGDESIMRRETSIMRKGEHSNYDEADATDAPTESTDAPSSDDNETDLDAETPDERAQRMADNDPNEDLVHAHTLHSNRTDITYNYKEEVVAAACEQHYEYMGDLTNEQCAQKCYETYGCTRFSAGGCKLGCRISTPERNDMEAIDEDTGGIKIKKLAVQPDRQCIPTSEGVDGECIVYQLTFFHALEQPAACHGNFELKPDIETKAECAHACKNHGSCKKFSTEPNCLYGCRISTDDTGCTTDLTMGCALYELHR